MARERRGGGSSRRRGGEAAGGEPAFKAPPYIKRKIPYYELLNDEELSIIENNAEIILDETLCRHISKGLKFVPLFASECSVKCMQPALS